MLHDLECSGRCSVCESPRGATMHFGARACRACAAFFRRSVSMRISYQCAAECKDFDTKCRIHHALRMTCRACRYDKCINAGMERKYVQNRRDMCGNGRRFTMSQTIRPTGIGAFHVRKRSDSDRPSMSGTREFTDQPTQSEDSVGSSSSAQGETSSSIDEDERLASAISNSSRIESDYQPSIPRLSTASPVISVERVIEAERVLNDNRRIVYGTYNIPGVFDAHTDLPFCKEDLQPMNFGEFNGPTRVDLMMMYQYLMALRFTTSLSPDDKRQTFRFLMAIDPMLTAAYLSMKLGKDNSWMVHSTGRYIAMNPTPNETLKFISEMTIEERRSYELYWPMKVAQYTHLCIPFAMINPSFVEFALLKVLALILRVRGKISSSGRSVTEEALRQTMTALYDHCVQEAGQAEGSLRFGNLILHLSPIHEVVSELIEGYVKIELFSLNKMDPVMRQMLCTK